MKNNVVNLFNRPVTSLVKKTKSLSDKLNDLESDIIEWGTSVGLDVTSKDFIYAEKIAKLAFAALLDVGESNVYTKQTI